MTEADRLTALSGIDSFGLMERAGQAVAAAALRHYPGAIRFAVLCGPGNNGGDGYIAARALGRAGAQVALYHLGERGALKGDARLASDLCLLASLPLSDYRPQSGDVVVDALFGAGLVRNIPEIVQETIRAVASAAVPVLAVDLPSGLCGRMGTARGAAFQADRTITFMAGKPGHLLLPGRSLCGTVEGLDIGMPERLLRSAAGRLRRNDPALWTLPRLDAESHKFRRGHLGVFSGGAFASGAARLSAMAGLRAGAGLVTIGAVAEALPTLANHMTAVMLRLVEDPQGVAAWIGDKRLSAFVLGPGFGDAARARAYVELLAGKPLVLDADGITAFRDRPERLFSLYDGSTEQTLVLTPHEGEFARLFPDIAVEPELSKVEKALAASARSKAVVVYKGADSVIASPDGRAFINANAPPWLATAGSGDVLAGIIGGLLAQDMPAFEAAAAGVWLHGAAGNRAGEGLTAEDLPTQIRLH